MNSADIASVIAENIRARLAFSAALLSLEGLTQAQFTAKHPDADIAALTSDPAFIRQVELFASTQAVQDYALDAQLRRGLSDSVLGFAAKMQAPDISGPALAAATDALTKISNLIEKREAAKREGGEQGLIRHVSKSWGAVSIRTIEGVTTGVVTLPRFGGVFVYGVGESPKFAVILHVENRHAHMV